MCWSMDRVLVLFCHLFNIDQTSQSSSCRCGVTLFLHQFLKVSVVLEVHWSFSWCFWWDSVGRWSFQSVQFQLFFTFRLQSPLNSQPGDNTEICGGSVHCAVQRHSSYYDHFNIRLHVQFWTILFCWLYFIMERLSPLNMRTGTMMSQCMNCLIIKGTSLVRTWIHPLWIKFTYLCIFY